MVSKFRAVTIGSLSAMLSYMAVCAGDTPQLAPSKPGFLDKQDTQEAPAEKKDTALSKEEISKISEALGNFVGRQLNAPGIELDVESVIKGIRDGAAGKPSPMDEKAYHEGMLKIQQNAFDKQSDKNLQTANDFLKQNASASGVIELEPGKLQYLILQPGTGTEVGAHDNPQIQYTGKYADGKVFGSSEDSGGPISIPLDQTIPGFSKGIKGMKEGEKRRLFIHPDLGYGTMGQLPPNSLLIFDIEVIKANSPKSSLDDEDDELSLADDEGDDEDDKDLADSHHSHPHKH